MNRKLSLASGEYDPHQILNHLREASPLLKIQACALILFVSMFAPCRNAVAQTETPPLKLLSPDEQLEITFALDPQGSAPVYSASYRGQQENKQAGTTKRDGGSRQTPTPEEILGEVHPWRSLPLNRSARNRT